MRWIVSIVLVALAPAAAVASGGSSPAAAPAGAYAVRFCQGSCSPHAGAVRRTGLLVLFDEPLRDQQGRTRDKWLEPGPINGCLRLDPVQGGAGWVFAPSAQTRRFVTWSVHAPDGTVRFELDRAPDAGYQVELKPSASGLHGMGETWSVPPGALDARPPDEVDARRIGKADPSRCPRLGVDSDAMHDVSEP
ncbi:hypothetical protein ATSB10_00030 [Dyella thiooxydans]|uniref:Uncharacterized protein n=2 Tax=Dyella thiooxydans TaxID=445710 RepID=A0A160MXF0_9GAMM|nr:hypothetical protein ATSB10_00030 [Dyella thiooxydans]